MMSQSPVDLPPEPEGPWTSGGVVYRSLSSAMTAAWTSYEPTVITSPLPDGTTWTCRVGPYRANPCIVEAEPFLGSNDRYHHLKWEEKE